MWLVGALLLLLLGVGHGFSPVVIKPTRSSHPTTALGEGQTRGLKASPGPTTLEEDFVIPTKVRMSTRLLALDFFLLTK